MGDPSDLTPDDYERQVKLFLESLNGELAEFRATHQEVVEGTDGDYTIDVVARFEALGGEIVVLVECKRHANPIERQVVQVLHAKLDSTGSHKGMIFTTSSFQSGAIEYASAHGIALVELVDGISTYRTRSIQPSKPVAPSPLLGAPAHAGWLVTLTETGHKQSRLVSVDHPKTLEDFLDLKGPKTRP